MSGGNPQIPAPYLVYAIGDVHGRDDLLAPLLAAIDADRNSFSGRLVVKIFLGDYIDRGPSSCAVIERLIAESNRPDQITIALLGNHERTLLDFLDVPSTGALWMQFGGRATLRSYLVPPPHTAAAMEWVWLREQLLMAMPTAHVDFLRGLPLCCQLGGMIFVHAGLRPGVPLALQSAEDLLWIRGEFLNAANPAELLVEHGHTPASEAQSAPGRLGIDTGAFATGILTAVRLDGGDREIIQVGNRHREESVLF